MCSARSFHSPLHVNFERTEVMGKSGSPKRLRDTAILPHELMHVIFGKLHLKDKLSAGLVCKHWDQLLKAGTADARHFHVEYNLDTLYSSTACKATDVSAPKYPRPECKDTILERCGTVLTLPVTEGSALFLLRISQGHLDVLLFKCGCLAFDNSV